MKSLSTIDTLKQMRFGAMAREYERQMNDAAAYGQLGFEERFSMLVDAEWAQRQSNKLSRIIHEAHFAVPGAMIEDIEYHADRKLDKVQILRFAACKYIEDGHHIILKGASGSGKTFLACALGNAACRKFKKVRYARMPELLEELAVAHTAGDLKKTLKEYRKADLLILDEWKLPIEAAGTAAHTRWAAVPSSTGSTFWMRLPSVPPASSHRPRAHRQGKRIAHTAWCQG